MTDSKIKYLLGIDGGGTKTEFLLTDLNENEIKRLFLGTSNPSNIGIENSLSVLSQGIREICADFNPEEISVFAGIAGSGATDTQETIRAFLCSFGFGAYSNASDAESAVSLALKGENGCAVIMGTGIIAFSCSDGNVYRTGGRGYLIDKGGSGFCLGSDVLNSAFEFLDGRGGSELIFNLVQKQLGKKLSDAVGDIYSGGVTFVASFAPVVFEAYRLGDEEAFKILERNTYEASKLIKASRRFLKTDEKTVICGGLCRQKDILNPFLQKHLGEDFPLIFTDEPMVNGAIRLAKINVQVGK